MWGGVGWGGVGWEGVRGQVKVIDPRGFDEDRPRDADDQVGLSGYRHANSYGTRKVKRPLFH